MISDEHRQRYGCYLWSGGGVRHATTLNGTPGHFKSSFEYLGVQSCASQTKSHRTEIPRHHRPNS